MEPQKSSSVDETDGAESQNTGEKSLPPSRHPAMGEISEHLLKRRFKARKPNEKWLTDVTELKGKDGKLYLSPILDLFNREIVAYAMRRNANSEMVAQMIEKAAPRLSGKGTMLHSDQGVLYRTAGYRELLAQHSMLQSMSRKAKSSWITAKSSTNTPK
ncbi:TPA: transposase family protein [Streptococcus pyogenes]|nr:transposase family protein [Streptococcus pyogenes]